MISTLRGRSFMREKIENDFVSCTNTFNSWGLRLDSSMPFPKKISTLLREVITNITDYMYMYMYM